MAMREMLIYLGGDGDDDDDGGGIIITEWHRKRSHCLRSKSNTACLLKAWPWTLLDSPTST